MYTGLTEDQVVQRFKGKIHCSQVVLMEMAEALGYDAEEAARIAAPFGGGMLRGDTCGAVTGALMAIGMRFGNSEHGNAAQDSLCREKVRLFQDRFSERFGSTICRELLGYDFSQPRGAQEIAASGKLFTDCPGYVLGALAILAEIFAEAEDD